MEDYKALSDRVVKLLRMDQAPVATALSMRPPEGVARAEGCFKACMGWDMARLDRKVFWADLENLKDCRNGLYYLGLAPAFEKLQTGEWWSGKYPDEGRAMFKTPGSSRRTFLQAAVIPTGTVKIISFAPLDLATFRPDVVLFLLSPKQAMYLARASLYANGGLAVGITGPSTCSTIVAVPYLTGESRHTLGCFGGRIFVKIKPEEIYMGVPMETLPQTVASLEELLAGRPDLDAILDEPAGVPHHASNFDLLVQKTPDIR